MNLIRILLNFFINETMVSAESGSTLTIINENVANKVQLGRKKSKWNGKERTDIQTRINKWSDEYDCLIS